MVVECASPINCRPLSTRTGDRPDRSGDFPVFLDACPSCWKVERKTYDNADRPPEILRHQSPTDRCDDPDPVGCQAIGLFSEDPVATGDHDGVETILDILFGQDPQEARVGTVRARTHEPPGFRPVEPNASGIAVGTSHHEMQLVVAECAIQDIGDVPYVRVCRAGGTACEVLDIYETQGP